MLIPYPFQQVAIDRGIKHNLLCADACGLGKTLVGIEIARRIQQERSHPVLVVCPKGTKLQWEYAIKAQGVDKSIRIDSGLDYKFAMEGSHTDTWFITHYAMFRGLKASDLLARTYFSTIILDESHRIKNRNAQQTVGVKKLLAFRKICLTATEMERSPADMWSLLNFMFPDNFRGFHGFAAQYVEYDEHPFFHTKKAVGAKNVKKLAHLLGNVFIKRRKEDVSEDLPPLTVTRTPVDMNSVLLGAYTDIETAGDIIVTVAKEEMIIPNVLAKLAKQRQLTSNGLGLVTSSKIAWVKNYVADNPGTKVLVFSVFRHTVEMLSELLDAPRVMGGEKHPDVQLLKPPLLVGTIKALGESFDLPWFDVAIFVDCEWSTTAMAQARDRIHRIGYTDPKQVIYLYHPGTVDDLVFDALDNKWSTLELVREYIRRYAQGSVDVL